MHLYLGLEPFNSDQSSSGTKKDDQKEVFMVDLVKNQNLLRESNNFQSSLNN